MATLKRVFAALVTIRNIVAAGLLLWGLLAQVLPLAGALRALSTVAAAAGLLLADLNNGIGIIAVVLHNRSDGNGTLHQVAHAIAPATSAIGMPHGRTP